MSAGLLAEAGDFIAQDELVLERWQRVLNFRFDDETAQVPFSEALAKEMDWSVEFRDLAIREYRKFLLLCSIYPGLMVPSIDVDTVWHWHLLYTRSYQRFCREALGQDFLHHEPSRGGPEEESLYADMYEESLKKYKMHFGQPPAEIWGPKALEL